MAIIGATKAENSGHLLIDAPEATAPGPYLVRIRSEIPGTSHLILIRQSIDAFTGAAPPQKVVVYAKRLDPGDAPRADLELAADSRQYLTLFAFAMGRWFTVTRDVKIGRAISSP